MPCGALAPQVTGVPWVGLSGPGPPRYRGGVWHADGPRCVDLCVSVFLRVACTENTPNRLWVLACPHSGCGTQKHLTPNLKPYLYHQRARNSNRVLSHTDEANPRPESPRRSPPLPRLPLLGSGWEGGKDALGRPAPRLCLVFSPTLLLTSSLAHAPSKLCLVLPPRPNPCPTSRTGVLYENLSIPSSFRSLYVRSTDPRASRVIPKAAACKRGHHRTTSQIPSLGPLPQLHPERSSRQGAIDELAEARAQPARDTFTASQVAMSTVTVMETSGQPRQLLVREKLPEPRGRPLGATNGSSTSISY